MNDGSMKHYVVYHNTAKQGPLANDGEFFAFANKSIQHLIGNRVWVISGEGKSSPKSYYLRYDFEVERVVDEGPQNQAFGSSGRRFNPPIQLDFLPWFADFLKGQQNFSLGVRKLTDDEINLLESVVPR